MKQHYGAIHIIESLEENVSTSAPQPSVNLKTKLTMTATGKGQFR